LLAINDFVINLNSKGQTDVIFLDFSNAFDRVSHQHLYRKLHHYGIRGSLLEWLKHFLSNSQQRVIVNGEQNDPADVTSGVPQDTVIVSVFYK